MPEKKEDSAASGLEKFNKNFLPYLLIAFNLIAFFYTQDQSAKQGVLVDLRKEVKELKDAMAPLITTVAVHGVRDEAIKEDIKKVNSRVDAVETRLSNFEKSQILDNGNRR